MVEAPEITVVHGASQPGWDRMVMRAANRSLPWWDMAAELVDNALANRKDAEPCRVEIEWQTKGTRRFLVRDHGRGAVELQPFLSPGKSGGNHSDLGNSTFGTGLFAVECVLSGRMDVATEASDGVIRRVCRVISKSQDGEATTYVADTDNRALFGLPGNGGTVVQFSAYQKRSPGVKDFQRTIDHLSRCYCTALAEEQLSIRAVLNEQVVTVAAQNRPAVKELFRDRVTAGEHCFVVEWGVTEATISDNGCRLIYGGKWFNTTTEPCGDYSLGRFYASVRVPQSAGLDSMDLLKRSIEQEFMDDLYDRCAELFKPQLEEANQLAESDQDKDLSERLSRMLTGKRRSGENGRSGDKDLREFKGRDPDGVGVEPKGTGRKRRGSRGGDNNAPSKLTVKWLDLGDEKPMAEYDSDGCRLTYNTSIARVSEWKRTQEDMALAQLAASFIAYRLANLDPAVRGQMLFSEISDCNFAEIYRQLVERLEQ